MHVALYLVVILCVGGIFAEFGCRNEDGELVDWFMLYKLPKERSSSSAFEKRGEAYAVLDSSRGTWERSKKSVEDLKSSIASTYMQILRGKKKVAYLIFNDQKPNSNSSSSSWGHTKGILSTDGTSAFWLVHSVPRFPPPPQEGKYDYPDNAKEHGQSLLCITVPFEQVPVIVSQFQFTKPQIYARQSNAAVNALPAPFRSFFTGSPTYVKKAPWSVTSKLRSTGKQDFTLFSKHQRWDKDLYDSLVAPSLSSSLYVQSWQVGRGTPLKADCADPFLVYNVDAVTLKYGPITNTSFLTTDDHSKWAVAQSGYPKWVCVGDINRMESQFKRGGGTVCINSPTAWKAYSSIITKYEGCPIVSRLGEK